MWDSHGKTGETSDQSKDETQAVQKRTFTRWMNVFLQRCDPPLEVTDLFTDIQDGRILMALLEELSGCKLLYRFRSSSHRIFRLNNISKALTCLDDRHVKLLDIDASSIADGVPSVVLNLLWNIVLHFQVRELAGGPQRQMFSSLSSSSLNTYPSTSDLSPPPNDHDSYFFNSLPRKGRKSAKKSKYHSKAIKTLLQQIQRCTSKYGVDVNDFGTSWKNGLAFLALIKSINPDLVDLRRSLSREPKENIQQAFMIAHSSLGVPPLLEPEDIMCTSPDEKSIITYVSMFLGHRSGTDEDHTANTDVPEIPNFGSLESVSFGETLAGDLSAQALLKSFEKSNEQLLWRQWSRRFSGTFCATSCNADRAFSPEPSSSPSPRRVIPPPSPLDACVVNQDVRLWLERGWGCRKKRAEESYVSLSSEEGIYSLSTLDSDEEDAYSYILDLNKDVFQPDNQPKRQVPKVEEETAEEMKEELKHQDCLGLFNGSQQNGHVDQDTDSDLNSHTSSQSAGDRKSRSGLREVTNKRAAFDLEPEDGRSKELEKEKAEKAPNKDDDEKKPKDGYDKKQDDAVERKTGEEAQRQKDVEEGGERELSVKRGNLSERRRAGEDLRRSEGGEDREKGGGKEEEPGSQKSLNSESFTGKKNERILTDSVAEDVRKMDPSQITTEEESDSRDRAVEMDSIKYCKTEVKMDKDDHLTKTSDNGPDWRNRKPEFRRHEALTATDQTGGVPPEKNTDGVQDGAKTQTSTCRTSQCFSSGGGLSLQAFAASCGITPLELGMLLGLWISLYCYLILPQMNP